MKILSSRWTLFRGFFPPRDKLLLQVTGSLFRGIKPTLEVCFGFLANFDKSISSKVLAAGHVDVTIKVGWKVNISVTNYGNLVRAKCAVKETKLEKDVGIRDGMFVATELVSDSGERITMARSTLFRIRVSSSISVLPGMNCSHQGEKVTSARLQPLINALAWDFAAVDEAMKIFVIWTFFSKRQK